METDGMAGHFLCFPRASGAFIQYRQENFLQEGLIEPGQITLVPTGHSAKWQAETPAVVDTVNLYLDPELLTGTVGHPVMLSRLPWFHDAALLTLAGLLADEAQSACPEGTLYTETLTRTIAARLALCYSIDIPRSHRLPSARAEVKAVAEIIRSTPAIDHSLSSLAASVCLSPSHLSRLFKAQMGKSVYAFLLETRLEAAHCMLRSGKANVSEAALACGFCDPAHLTRHFRRRYQYLPSKIRP